MKLSILHILFLLISLVNGLPEVLKAEDYYVSEIPDIVAYNSTQYAGLIPIRENAHIFFWLFEQEENPGNTDKLTIWLNGGPGCSSMDGVFMENGPYTFDENNRIINNPYSWNKHSSIVYVDQPTGTGFSYTKSNDIPRSEVSVGKDFNTFLAQFFRVFPQYENAEIYIAGESFAGTYIPYIAMNLLKNPVNDKMINLKSIAIGNGWIDPLRQYQGYLDYALKFNLVDEVSYNQIQKYVEKCNLEYQRADTIKNYSCEYILDTILNASTKNGKNCINMYDIRLRDSDKRGGCGLYSWPLTLGGMTRYLRRPDVIEALHVTSTPHSWTECTSRVSSALSGDNSKPSYTLFPELLENIKITLFVGDQDLICNYVGIEKMIDNLTWNGIKGFTNKYIDWVVNGEVNGVYQSERNLTYIRITNGSHMVPIDLPEESLVMFNNFIGINEEEKASLDNKLDYESGNKKLAGIKSSVTESESSSSKFISISLLSIGLIAGIAIIGYHKRRNSNHNEAEWHELIENENNNDNDNVIDIDIDDESLLNTNIDSVIDDDDEVLSV